MGLGRALRVAAVLAICVLVFAAGTTNGAEPRGGAEAGALDASQPRRAPAAVLAAVHTLARQPADERVAQEDGHANRKRPAEHHEQAAVVFGRAYAVDVRELGRHMRRAPGSTRTRGRHTQDIPE